MHHHIMESTIDQVLDWASSSGIRWNGIRPQCVAGRGIGIFAARQLAAGEVVLRVPADMLRTIHNTPRAVVAALPGASTHAILAASLVLDDHPSLRIWALLFPSREDVWACMPICWPAWLQHLLPDGAREILKTQQKKFSRDWSAFTTAFPGVAKDEYLYKWLLVNTRTFYYKHKAKGASAAAASPAADRHMALQPIADLFNHLPGDHCEAAFTADGFRFTTNRAYRPGEELYVRYGAHANDTLLVEYGFTLPLELNPWDEVSLTGYMQSLFNRDQRELLEETGFWGRYALDCRAVCYRTQIALRLHCLSQDTWKQILSGERDEDRDSEVANERLRVLLTAVEASVAQTLERLENIKAREELARQQILCLLQRWHQIHTLVKLELGRLSGGVAAPEAEDESDDVPVRGEAWSDKMTQELVRKVLSEDEEEAVPEKMPEVLVQEAPPEDEDEAVPEWA